MATLVRERERVRPAWPDPPEPSDRTDVIDLRDDPDATFEGQPRHAADRVEVVDRPSLGWRLLHGIALLVAAAIVAGVAVLATVNRDDTVPIDVVSQIERFPLWAVIAAPAAAGFVAGRLMDSRRR